MGLTIIIHGLQSAELIKELNYIRYQFFIWQSRMLLGVFLVGPKIMSLNIFTNSFGGYINNIVSESFSINPFGDNSWLGSWTIFYWSWWIAWGPFVGTFIARISKGRTIKEFVLGVIIAHRWFPLFGSRSLAV